MPNVDSTPINETSICEKHAHILAARAIPAAFALAHGVRSIDLTAARDFEKKHGLKKAYTGLPYYPVTGLLIEYPPCLDGVARYRVRADATEVVLDGEIEGTHHGEQTVMIPRYIAQAGVSVAPYITPEAMAAANDTSIALYITEAPLKALSLTANGWPAIGMGGIYAGVVDLDLRKETDQLVAHQEMRRIRWSGRTAYICYDAGIGSADDGLGNPQVAQAAARLWRCLSDLGASVRMVHTPYTHPQQADLEVGQIWSPTDQGPDDYIAVHGPAAFLALIDASVPADPVVRIKEGTDGLRGAERAQAIGRMLREPFVQASLYEASESTISAVVALGLRAREIKSIAAEFGEKLAAKIKDDEPEWTGGFRRSASGALRPIRENVELALEHDPALQGLIAFDSFARNIVMLKEPPWKGKAGPWSDVDDIYLAGYLAAKYELVDVHDKKIRAAVVGVSHLHEYHPIQAYLAGVSWDGQHRVGSWLSTYLGVELSEYSANVGKWWLISAVARAMVPGAKVDHTLILDGDQGAAKSSALEVLGGEWFSDADLGDLKSKESALAMQGCWILELAEGEIFDRASTKTLKKYATKRRDDVVLKFSNLKTRLERQVVFALTCNEFEFVDKTGNRRFWPVRVGQIDLEQLKRDRDQLWAEAVQLYQSGAKWWPVSESEKQLCESEQQQHEAQDPWIERILAGLKSTETTSVSEVLDIVDIPLSRRKRAEACRAAECLRAIGWIEGTSRKGGVRRWGRGLTAEPLQDFAADSNVVRFRPVEADAVCDDEDEVIRRLMDGV